MLFYCFYTPDGRLRPHPCAERENPDDNLSRKIPDAYCAPLLPSRPAPLRNPAPHFCRLRKHTACSGGCPPWKRCGSANGTALWQYGRYFLPGPPCPGIRRQTQTVHICRKYCPLPGAPGQNPALRHILSGTAVLSKVRFPLP